MKQLGTGSQGEVYLSQVRTSSQQFVCVIKMRKVLNNDKLCAQIFASMFREFEIGRKLDHAGIIKNMYFVRRRNEADEQENLIMLEVMEGGNAQEFIDSRPAKKLTDLLAVKSYTR